MNDTNKVFFDSNVLIYVVDDRDKRKQQIAVDLVTKSIEDENGMISTQSLQEFYNASTRKLLCTPDKAKYYARNFAESFGVKQVDTELIFNAIDISIKNQLSFWDSLIVSAAQDSGCIAIYTEDLNSDQVIEGVKILNPFSPAN